MLNHLFSMGRLTRDPELRRTGTGIAVASFTLAVDRTMRPRTEANGKRILLTSVAWRSNSGVCSPSTSPRAAWLWFPAACRSAPGRTRTAINAAALRWWPTNVYFGDSKRDTESSGGYNAGNSYNAGSSYGSGNSYGSGGYSAPAAPSYAAPASAPASDFAMLEDDDAQLPF